MGYFSHSRPACCRTPWASGYGIAGSETALFFYSCAPMRHPCGCGWRSIIGRQCRLLPAPTRGVHEPVHLDIRSIKPTGVSSGTTETRRFAPAAAGDGRWRSLDLLDRRLHNGRRPALTSGQPVPISWPPAGMAGFRSSRRSDHRDDWIPLQTARHTAGRLSRGCSRLTLARPIRCVGTSAPTISYVSLGRIADCARRFAGCSLRLDNGGSVAARRSAGETFVLVGGGPYRHAEFFRINRSDRDVRATPSTI